MDFEDLQKVWNQENNQPMYVFDQEALNRMVARRARSVSRLATINEWGMMIVALVTSGLLVLTGSDGAYRILAAVVMLGTGAYVWWQRQQRLSRQETLGKAVAQEIDQAVANAQYLVRFAQTFSYWFLLPTAGITLFRMSRKNPDLWQWGLIIGCFILSYALVQMELRWKHLPRLKRLEELRNKIMA